MKIKVGDLVRPLVAKKAMGLVVEVIDKKKAYAPVHDYAVIEWITCGKHHYLGSVYQQHMLEVINEER